MHGSKQSCEYVASPHLCFEGNMIIDRRIILIRICLCLCLMPLQLSYLLFFIFGLFEAATYSSSEGLPTPPAFTMNNHLPSEMNFPMHRHQPTDNSIEEYPERPGEPECSFFLKTGDCKYRSNCKFHHPKSRMFRKPNTFTLSDKGLPLRPVSFSYFSPTRTRKHRYMLPSQC